MKLNRTPLAAALCCLALGSGSALAAADSTTGPSASPMDRGASSSMDRSRMGAAAANMDSQTVRQVQQALRDKGHNPGPIDGMMGPRTQAALQSYQRSENMSGASGMDQRTLDSLGVQASSGSPGSGSTRGSGDSGSSAGGASGTTGGSGGAKTGAPGGKGGTMGDPSATPGSTPSGTGTPSGSGTR